MSQHFPKALSELVSFVNDLPGIGPRTAQRLAIFLLRSGPQYLEKLAGVLLEIKDNFSLCSLCHNFSLNAKSVCYICADTNRDHGTICIVKDIMDLTAIEASESYNGVYHVLNGAINPLEGITPKDLNIAGLMERIEKSDPQIKEIVLGLDTDTKGETTCLYLISQLKDKGIKITRLGRGLPTGSDLEYADAQTLKAALQGRKEYK